MEREYEVGLYKHNKIAYENVCKMFETENKVCIIQATGTGKSFVALQLMYDFLKNNSEKHIKFFAPQNGILEQLREHIKTLSVDSHVFDNVEFLTYQSLLNMTRKEIKDMDIDLMVTDEFHRLGAPEWKKRLELIEKTHPHLKVFGMSATPVRARGTALEEDVSETFFEGKVANKYELYQALADGVLPTPEYHVAITVLLDECDDLEERIKNGKATTEEKQEYMEMLSDIRKRISEGESVEDVLKKYVKPDGKYIYFCSKGSDVKNLQDKISSIYKGVNYEFYYVHSMEQSDKENNVNSNNFYKNITMDGQNAEGKLRIMFALDMYNEGIHVPDIDGVIMGRSTSSDILFYQQLGRAIAVKGDNSTDFHPLVIDLVNNIGAIEELYNRVLKEKESIKDQLTHEESEKEERDFDKFNMDINFGLSDEIINVLDALCKLNNMFGKSGLSFEEKLNEAYEYLKKNCSLPFRSDKQVKFSDGTMIGNWLFNSKKELEKLSQTNEKARTIINELNRRKGLSFEEKLSEVYNYLQENGMLPSRQDRQVKFSDGTLISNWNAINKIKLEELSESNEKARAIVNELNSRHLSFEEKLSEVYEYLQEHGKLPSDGDKTVKFSDGPCIGSWITTNKIKLEELSKTNEKARAIIDELNRRKGLSFEEKLSEVYEYLQERGKLPKKHDSNVRFSDGTLIGNWLYDNKGRLKELSGTNEQARLIINKVSYTNYSGRLSFEEKLSEVYKYLQERGKLPSTSDRNIKFSDGVAIANWLVANKKKLEELSDINEQAMAIISKLVLKNELVFLKKSEEIYEYLCKHGKIPKNTDRQAKFSDDTFMRIWLNNNKQKIYELYLVGDELAVKLVNAILEIKPNYFDKVKIVIETKKEFEKSQENENKKEAGNGRGIQ